MKKIILSIIILIFLTGCGIFDLGNFILPNLASDPTENNVIGQICMVSGILKY